VNVVIEQYDNVHEEPGPHGAATGKAASIDYINYKSVAGWTVLLTLEH